MDPAHDPALHDDLTGALNRRYLRELFEREWSEWLQGHERVALLLLDLDLFKEVNDRYGHLVGDAVLRSAVERFRGSLRASDPLVRYGGDEFVVVLPGLSAEEAHELAVRARRQFAASSWRHPETARPLGIPISFSIGAAAAPDDGSLGDSVLVAADRRLYEDKRSRNEARLAKLRRRRVLVGALAVVVTLAGASWLLQRSSPPALEAAAPEARSDESPELQALRLEVERLSQALAAERAASADSRDSERRIQELEKLLAEAQSRVSEVVETPAVVPPAREARAEPRESETAAAHPPAPRPLQAASIETPPTPVELAPAPVVTAPRLLRHDAPIYPILARRQRVEGSVVLELEVDASGRVVRLRQLSAPLGYGLDEAARRAARSARYRPAESDGVAVSGAATLTIRFRLERDDGA